MIRGKPFKDRRTMSQVLIYGLIWDNYDREYCFKSKKNKFNFERLFLFKSHSTPKNWKSQTSNELEKTLTLNQLRENRDMSNFFAHSNF